MALPSTLAALALDPGKPDVPEFDPIDLQTVLRDTIGANLGNFGDIKQLASGVNRFQRNQLMKGLEKVFPGAGRIIGQASDFIQSQLSGEIPADVRRQIETYGAEAATAGGYGGSLFAGAKTAKDLGLTSLQIMNQGLHSAERWLAQSQSRVPLFNPASMFATPEMGVQTAMFNSTNQWNRDWLNEQIDHSLGMFEQAIMNSMQQMDQLVLSGASMGMSAGMGGMGGMGGSGSSYNAANLGSYGTQFDDQMNARGASILGGGGGIGF